mgnify:FL=1
MSRAKGRCIENIFSIRLGNQNDAHFFNLTGNKMSDSTIDNSGFKVADLNLDYKVADIN